jgi:glucosamine 6-phosphate synthetase-like amidotransferase/phosphosugar isomerase protein
MVNVVALQLLAYYSAQARGTDMTSRVNLAKSVTVE